MRDTIFNRPFLLAAISTPIIPNCDYSLSEYAHDRLAFFPSPDRDASHDNFVSLFEYPYTSFWFSPLLREFFLLLLPHSILPIPDSDPSPKFEKVTGERRQDRLAESICLLHVLTSLSIPPRPSSSPVVAPSFHFFLPPRETFLFSSYSFSPLGAHQRGVGEERHGMHPEVEWTPFSPPLRLLWPDQLWAGDPPRLSHFLTSCSFAADRSLFLGDGARQRNWSRGFLAWHSITARLRDQRIKKFSFPRRMRAPNNFSLGLFAGPEEEMASLCSAEPASRKLSS